jgi:hypothetical protein
LGNIGNVTPEILNASHSDWIGHSREVLEKKRAAAAKGVEARADDRHHRGAQLHPAVRSAVLPDASQGATSELDIP